MKLVLNHVHERLEERFEELLAGERLRIIRYPRPGFQQKVVLVSVRFGAADRELPSGEPIPAGTAHFFEHRAFSRPEGAFQDRFARLGAQVNAATGVYRTTYYCLGAVDPAQALSLLLELVFRFEATDEGVALEREIIRREIAEEQDNRVIRLFQQLHELLYWEHPVRARILGSEQSLEAITPELLSRCHQEFYRPENAVVFLYDGGDFSGCQAVLEEFLSHPPSPAATEGPAPAIPGVEEPASPRQPSASVTLDGARPLVAVGFKEPAPSAPGLLGRTLATQVGLEAIFGPGTRWHERMYGAGVVDDSLALGYSQDLGQAYAYISGETVDPERFQQEVAARLREVARVGLPSTSITRLSRRISGALLRSFNTPEEALGLFASYWLLGASALDFFEELEALDTGRVEERLASLLVPRQQAVSVVLPGSRRRRRR